MRKISEREAIIDEFNASADIPVLFLTTGVGGVGITLTGADRVILFDPSWNPATDAQAVDRAYRVGQTRPVIVYRLVTCGTVEEKILRNQIFKRGLHKIVLQQENQQRYFTKAQLRELFTLGRLDASDTHQELTAFLNTDGGWESVVQAVLPGECSHHVHRQLVQTLGRGGGGAVRGVSDYHLLFSTLAVSALGDDCGVRNTDLSATPARRGGRGGYKGMGGARKAREETNRAVTDLLVRGAVGQGRSIGSPFQTKKHEDGARSPFADRSNSWNDSPSGTQVPPQSTATASASKAEAEVGQDGGGGWAVRMKRQALSPAAAAQYNMLLQAAEEQRASVETVVRNACSNDGSYSSDGGDAQARAGKALACWLDALTLADDDICLQQSALALGCALGLAPSAPAI